MVTVTIAMVVLGIATAINPLGVSIVVLLLMSRNGLRKAWAFVTGSTLAIVAASLLAMVLTFLAIKATGSNTHAGVAKLMGLGELVFGLGMLGLGIWTMTAGSASANSTVTKLMRDSDTVKPWFAFGLGLMFVSYTFPFIAVAELAGADITAPLQDLALYLVYLALSLVTILVPVVLRLAWPERSAGFLERSRVWLMAHGATVSAIVFILLGASFALKGLGGFLG
jgi:uncharacterized paraquat-inducible protein A